METPLFETVGVVGAGTTGKGFYSYPNPTFQIPGWLKGDEDEASR